MREKWYISIFNFIVKILKIIFRKDSKNGKKKNK